MTWHGMATHCMAWHGMALYCTEILPGMRITTIGYKISDESKRWIFVRCLCTFTWHFSLKNKAKIVKLKMTLLPETERHKNSIANRRKVSRHKNNEHEHIL